MASHLKFQASYRTWLTPHEFTAALDAAFPKLPSPYCLLTMVCRLGKGRLYGDASSSIFVSCVASKAGRFRPGDRRQDQVSYALIVISWTIQRHITCENIDFVCPRILWRKCRSLSKTM